MINDIYIVYGLIVAFIVFLGVLHYYDLLWIVFSIGRLASVFAVAASVIRFQIMGALGFTLVAVICTILISKTSR